MIPGVCQILKDLGLIKKGTRATQSRAALHLVSYKVEKVPVLLPSLMVNGMQLRTLWR